MKKFRSILLTLIILYVMSLLMTGCQEVPSNGVCLVLGNHRYFPKVNLQAEAVYNKIYSAAYSYGDCSIVVSDGQPFVSSSFNISKPDANIDNAKRKQIAKQNTEKIILSATRAVAKTPEIDTLKAISQGGKMLNGSSADSKELLVFDSGLSTTGLLNFASENLIEVEPSLIVDRLNELKAIPDLKGVHIIWTGCGEVSGEQHQLTESYKYKLKNIWEAILLSSGATVEFIDVPLSYNEAENELPHCSTITVVQDSLELSGDIAKPIKFGEDTIKFLGDQAVYVNAADAKKALEPIATFLKENATKRILIVGTTASAGKDSSCLSLSFNRANACKKTLVEMGVKENQIETLGLGRKECFLRVNDLDSNGRLMEALASQNRAVFIFDTDCSEANRVKQLG